MSDITLLNMDCMDYMRDLPDNAYELAIVDPPYGIGIVEQLKKTTDSSSSMMKGMNGVVGGNWDNSTPSEEYFGELKRVSINQIIWGGNYFLDFLGATRCFCIWDKMNGTNNMADAELAWTNFNGSVRMFRMHHFSSGYEKKQHPCQKPTRLYEWLLTNYAKPGYRILDTHLGSGSSAASNLGFDFVGIELDAGYFAAAKQRLENHQKQPRMFDMPLDQKPEQGVLI